MQLILYRALGVKSAILVIWIQRGTIKKVSINISLASKLLELRRFEVEEITYF